MAEKIVIMYHMNSDIKITGAPKHIIARITFVNV